MILLLSSNLLNFNSLLPLALGIIFHSLAIVLLLSGR